MFSLIRNCQTVQSGYTVLHSRQQCRRVLAIAHLHQLLVWIVFKRCHSSGLKWYLMGAAKKHIACGNSKLCDFVK